MRKPTPIVRLTAFRAGVPPRDAPVKRMLSVAGEADADILGGIVRNVGPFVEPRRIRTDAPRNGFPDRTVVALPARFVINGVGNFMPNDIFHDGPSTFDGIESRQRDDAGAAALLLPSTNAQPPPSAVVPDGPSQRKQTSAQLRFAQR